MIKLTFDEYGGVECFVPLMPDHAETILDRIAPSFIPFDHEAHLWYNFVGNNGTNLSVVVDGTPALPAGLYIQTMLDYDPLDGTLPPQYTLDTNLRLARIIKDLL